MTVIRVNPESVRAYGADAQNKFDAIRAELVALVNAVVEVRYFGPNAVQFKTKSGQLASEFANQLNTDLRGIAETIKISTSNIAASLGGGPVVIEVNGTQIVPPAVESVDFVDIDTSALQALTGNVNRHFSVIEDSLQQHLSRLQSTDWVGNAQQQALDRVSQFTNSARMKCTEAQSELNSFIANQVDSALRADH